MKSVVPFVVSVACMLVQAGAVSAQIPNNAQFELEGNAVVNNPPADDWANTVPTKSGTSEASEVSFIADGSGNATIFTGGGSKDTNDLNQWAWKDQLGGLPDKDNITNAYAAAYPDALGNLIIYFGADRFANSGDAQLGFWFFQSQVGAVGGKFVGPDGVTPAVHTVGDILVLANAVNGGSVVQIQVLRWNGTGLTLLQNDLQAKCGTNADPNVCMIGNGSTSTPAPWPYTPKSGVSGVFPPNSFAEGGIVINAFSTGGQAECFSSFLAETRSSTSQTATLKDFALGQFNTCKVDISKTCSTVAFDDATGLLNYGFDVTVTNSGFGTLHDLVVTDNPDGAPVQTFTAASLAGGQSVTFPGTFSLTPGTETPNPPTNIASVVAASSPGGVQTVTAGPATADCPHVSFDANLTVTKQCATRLEVQNGRVVVAVDIQGEVCNVVSGGPDFPSPIDDVVVTDTPSIPPISLGTLATGECKPYTSVYFPDFLFNGSGLPHDQSYTDTVLASGHSRFNDVDKQNTASANCPLCP
jgi:hypothetical protein